MTELQGLQKDTQEIACPCKKPNCPFNDATCNLTKLYMTSSLESLDYKLRQNSSNIFNGFSNNRRYHNGFNLMSPRSDCEVAIEEEPDSDSSYEFKRNTPSRIARRKPLRRSQSQSPSEVSSSSRDSKLSLPSQPLHTPTCRSMSLPGCSRFYGFDFDSRFGDYEACMQFNSRNSLSHFAFDLSFSAPIV